MAFKIISDGFILCDSCNRRTQLEGLVMYQIIVKNYVMIFCKKCYPTYKEDAKILSRLLHSILQQTQESQSKHYQQVQGFE